MQAQDTLFKWDGSIQFVKIIDAQGAEVAYVYHDSNDISTYIISKAYIRKIIYHTGLIETFFPDDYLSIGRQRRRDPLAKDFGRHFISFNVLDYFQNSMTVGYEYLGKSGKWGVEVPITFRIVQGANKDFGTGISYHWYPFGQGRIRYFGGPSFEYSKRSEYYGNRTELAFLLQNGCLFQVSKNINTSVSFGAGYVSTYLDGWDYYPGFKKIRARATFNIGFKF